MKKHIHRYLDSLMMDGVMNIRIYEKSCVTLFDITTKQFKWYFKSWFISKFNYSKFNVLWKDFMIKKLSYQKYSEYSKQQERIYLSMGKSIKYANTFTVKFGGIKKL